MYSVRLRFEKKKKAQGAKSLFSDVRVAKEDLLGLPDILKVLGCSTFGKRLF